MSTLTESLPPDEVTPDPQLAQQRRAAEAMAWKILGVTFLLSVLLGVTFLYQYLTTMRFIREHLNEPATPHAWSVTPLSPDECVTEALDWARECRGIKSLCDMYSDRVMEYCMDSQPREAYCRSLGDITRTARFGFAECQARGVRRNIDAEICSKAYRFTATYCELNFPPPTP